MGRRSATSTSSSAATAYCSRCLGTFIYRVQRTQIVEPTALWVTRKVGYDRLVLTACHPLYSAAQRVVAFARLVRREAPSVRDE